MENTHLQYVPVSQSGGAPHTEKDSYTATARYCDAVHLVGGYITSEFRVVLQADTIELDQERKYIRLCKPSVASIAHWSRSWALTQANSSGRLKIQADNVD